MDDGLTWTQVMNRNIHSFLYGEMYEFSTLYLKDLCHTQSLWKHDFFTFKIDVLLLFAYQSLKKLLTQNLGWIKKGPNKLMIYDPYWFSSMYLEVDGTIRILSRFEFAVANFFRLISWDFFPLPIFSFLLSGEVFQILMTF